MTNRENYKIIKVINEQNIVINAGKDKGLEEGTELEIFTPGEVLVDPETKEELGTLDIVKADIELTTLYEKFSICKNSAYVTTNPIIGIAESFEQRRRKDLNIDTTEISGYGVDEYSKKIKIGDLVRKKL